MPGVEMQVGHAPAASRIERVAVVVLLLMAASQYAWNAYGVPPLSGYDAGAHAGYILTLVEERRLPHPMDPQQGWSTFHPPLYYLIGSVVWAGLEPFGPRALSTGLRGISAIACLAAGLTAYVLVRRAGVPWLVAWVATALVLFVPCIQMAAVMIGNEAFAYGIASLSLVPLLSLHRDPRNRRTAALTGLLAGLAFATKFSGAFVVAACAVPFVRADFDRRMLRSLAALTLVGMVLAGPVYVRNVVVAGTPFPILRGFEPTKRTEAANVLRPRKPTDYLWFNPACLVRPSLQHVREGSPGPRRNMAMTNIWGLAYATIWYDAFGHRIPRVFHRDGVRSGPLLAGLGLVPTLAMLLGFALALVESVRRRGRSTDAPLVVIWLVGLASFVSFTWWAPSAVAVKGSYMLSLAVPGAVFFARGVMWLGARLRVGVLVLSTAAAFAAAVIFTHALVFPPLPQRFMANLWRVTGFTLPDSHITDAVNSLTGGS